MEKPGKRKLSSSYILYSNRIKAIEGVYASYARIGNKELARKTCRLIDVVWPADIKKVSGDPKRDVIFKKFGELSETLKSVKTAEDWVQINAELVQLAKGFRRGSRLIFGAG